MLVLTTGAQPGAQLSVRMGGVTVHVGDREALASFMDAWRQAAELADTAFGSPQEKAVPAGSGPDHHDRALRLVDDLVAD